MTSNPRSKNKSARSASERAKTIPRDKYGRFIKGTIIIIDEYGDPGLTKKASSDFGIVAASTKNSSKYSRSVAPYDRYNLHGGELKAKDASMEIQKRTLKRIGNSGAEIYVVNIDKQKISRSRYGSILYKSTVTQAIKKIMRDVGPNEKVTIIADRHSAWGKDDNIRSATFAFEDLFRLSYDLFCHCIECLNYLRGHSRS